jgi:hypothetical protein
MVNLRTRRGLSGNRLVLFLSPTWIFHPALISFPLVSLFARRPSPLLLMYVVITDARFRRIKAHRILPSRSLVFIFFASSRDLVFYCLFTGSGVPVAGTVNTCTDNT